MHRLLVILFAIIITSCTVVTSRDIVNTDHWSTADKFMSNCDSIQFGMTESEVANILNVKSMNDVPNSVSLTPNQILVDYICGPQYACDASKDALLYSAYKIPYSSVNHYLKPNFPTPGVTLTEKGFNPIVIILFKNGKVMENGVRFENKKIINSTRIRTVWDMWQNIVTGFAAALGSVAVGL